MAEFERRIGRKALGKNGEFTYGIGPRKLNDIVNNKLRELDFTLPDAVFDQLSAGDKKALSHLVKAAEFLDTVFLKQDHPDNLRALKKLNPQIRVIAASGLADKGASPSELGVCAMLTKPYTPLKLLRTIADHL